MSLSESRSLMMILSTLCKHDKVLLYVCIISFDNKCRKVGYNYYTITITCTSFCRAGTVHVNFLRGHRRLLLFCDSLATTCI